MNIFHLLTFFVIAVAIDAEKASFEGFKLYKVVPKTKYEVDILENMRAAGVGDIWNEHFYIDDDVRVMVSPEMQPVFTGQLMRAHVDITTVIENVQKAIDDQLQPATRQSRSASYLSYNWNEYLPLARIEQWLDELATEHPDVVTTVTMNEKSVEGRDIKGIVINYNPSRQKPLAMIEGTLHAREWISPATVTWMVKEFLTSTDPDVRFMAENLEWHVFPVVNPDGYVYTFEQNRMWRKNRSRANFTTCPTGTDDDMSNGVDLNRNFDFYWMTIGASSDPCSNTFAGPSIASEPETRAIVDYVLKLNQTGDIIYYLSFHSWSQVFIVPYSHVNEPDDYRVDNYDDLVEIANNSIAKLTARHGTTYRAGISFETLRYLMTGASFDWVKKEVKVPISYLIELRDLGQNGFLLPAAEIIPNNEEIMDAMVEMDKSTRRLGYYSGSSTLVYSVTLLLSGLIYINLFN